MGQYLGPFLDIHLDIRKEQILEAQNYEMISKLVVWHLCGVLNKYLDL